MASFISTRQAEQCRSHHQKMEKKYFTFYQILLKLRMDFYSTANPEELKADLEQNGFKLKDTTLLSEEELKMGNSSKREKRKESNEQDTPNDSFDDSMSERSENNLLNEDYENNL